IANNAGACEKPAYNPAMYAPSVHATSGIVAQYAPKMKNARNQFLALALFSLRRLVLDGERQWPSLLSLAHDLSGERGSRGAGQFHRQILSKHARIAGN